MVKDLVGYRFCPTGEELVNHYLKNKILGKSWLVDEAISEINIYNYEPDFLPSLSKIQSNDPVWYFFSTNEYVSEKNKKGTKRTTVSGFWKATGKDRKIKDKRGNGVDIGIKKTLVYHEGRSPNGVRTPWIMHEYHITCMPHLQIAYVICQVMYKGEEVYIPSGGNNSSEPSQSLVSDLNTGKAISTPPEVEMTGEEDLYFSLNDLNEHEDLSQWDAFDPNTFINNNNYSSNMQLQNPYLSQADDDFLSGLNHVNRSQVEHLFSDQDQSISRWTRSMQENFNNHTPKKSLSGIIVDYSSDSDSNAESISAKSYQGTSSPANSIGSSNEHFPSCRDETLSSSTYYSYKDVQTSAKISIHKTREAQLTRRTRTPSKQEVKQVTSRSFDASMVKTEKKGLFITENAMEKTRKKPPYIYLMNMIIGFILLVALIGNIIQFY